MEKKRCSKRLFLNFGPLILFVLPAASRVALATPEAPAAANNREQPRRPFPTRHRWRKPKGKAQRLTAAARTHAARGRDHPPRSIFTCQIQIHLVLSSERVPDPAVCRRSTTSLLLPRPISRCRATSTFTVAVGVLHRSDPVGARRSRPASPPSASTLLCSGPVCRGCGIHAPRLVRVLVCLLVLPGWCGVATRPPLLYFIPSACAGSGAWARPEYLRRLVVPLRSPASTTKHVCIGSAMCSVRPGRLRPCAPLRASPPPCRLLDSPSPHACLSFDPYGWWPAGRQFALLRLSELL